MDAQERQWLQNLVASVARIEGRLDEIETAQHREIDGLHNRIDSARRLTDAGLARVESRLERDIAEIRKPAAVAGGAVAVAISAIFEAARRVIGL